MNRISGAAQLIAATRRNRAPLRSLPADLAPRDEAEGYRTQRAVHDLLLPHCGAIVGLQDRLHQRGDAAISRYPASLQRRGIRQGRSRQRRVAAGGRLRPRRRRMRDRRSARRVISQHRRHRSRPTRSRRRSRPICPRLKSSMTVTLTGKPWARRRWSPTISLPPAA